MTHVLMLHGVGGNGAGLLPLASHLDLPGLTFSAPNAPHPAGPGAWAWFDIAGVTVENRPARVRAARAGLDALIEGTPVLLGFSQGSIMALDALARGKVATVVAFAGRLAFDGPLTPQAGARVLLLGGQHDPMMPPDVTREAAARLQAAGVTVQMLIEPIGHEIGPQGLAAARKFLQ
ncbi:hypothetical protein NX862_00795 [Rhodobacter sp. KR11]|jgi:phospholipase/carboxylesterase|uniref:alpha/beta hydrolase n=1 Tax=Rhodobacter sp. KR11 TaxID=2974588 RepID=UPI0022224D7D|nr:hypothetical protein [Rhodobacter sp. KR11]MCW1917284.1 hypothetical protein [Rhodobacter sp. KR11]